MQASANTCGHRHFTLYATDGTRVAGCGMVSASEYVKAWRNTGELCKRISTRTSAAQFGAAVVSQYEMDLQLYHENIEENGSYCHAIYRNDSVVQAGCLQYLFDFSDHSYDAACQHA